MSAVKSSLRVSSIFLFLMKPCSWVLLLLGLTLVAALRGAEPELIWSDEFNYEGAPDPTKWSYEEGYLRNHEQQFYTVNRRENARVEKGLLILEARKENYRVPDGAQNTQGRQSADYTAASLNTLGKFSVQNGRIEMRAKLPHGKGVWPAFWMLGENIPQVGWPRCGEIDIMELVGKEPGWIYGTAHWRGPEHHEAQGNKLHVDGTDTDFHVYAVDWTPEKLDFSVDGKVYNSVPVSKAGEGADNPFRKPQYLLLNFALGGDWGGEIDDSVLPQRYLIDYVRIYRRK